MTIDVQRRIVTQAIATLPVLLSAHARAAGQGIDETGFIKVGRIDQWVSVQGRDRRNPAILYLHGGPGEAQSPFLKNFLPWQQDFTVANWDQRGAGKTFGTNGPSTPGMDTPESAVEQLVTDAIEVATHVSKRLSKKKIVLVGQSWGAMLGLYVVKRRPDLFHAYVATGDTVDWPRSITELERMARLEATAAHDQETLKALDATATLPLTDQKRRGASAKYRMIPSDLGYLKNFDAFIGPPPLPTHGDAADWLGGYNFSGSKVAPAMYTFNAAVFAPELRVPYFVIQGRDDHITPASLAQQYVAKVKAPRKSYTTIPGGHFACFTSSREFLDALHKNVDPIVT
jgi:pimeloyl-ACP methyl ester carboxylesterase